MTAVFGRTKWKYDFPRAYRAILLERATYARHFA